MPTPKSLRPKSDRQQALANQPAAKKPWLFSKTNRPAHNGTTKGQLRKNLTLLQRFDKALRIGGGDKVVMDFMKNERKKFFELYASMQPKNVSVKQEHTINFVELPPKAPLPSLPEPEVIDVGFDSEGVHGVSDKILGV